MKRRKRHKWMQIFNKAMEFRPWGLPALINAIVPGRPYRMFESHPVLHLLRPRPGIEKVFVTAERAVPQIVPHFCFSGAFADKTIFSVQNNSFWRSVVVPAMGCAIGCCRGAGKYELIRPNRLEIKSFSRALT